MLSELVNDGSVVGERVGESDLVNDGSVVGE